MNIVSSLQLIGSNLAFYLGLKSVRLPEKKIIRREKTVDAFLALASKSNLKIAYIDDVTTLLLYEGLLVSRKIKPDFSTPLYKAIEEKMKIPSDTLTFKVMEHITNSYLKSFQELDGAFITPTRKMRYVIKCSPKGKTYFYADTRQLIAKQIPSLLKKKRVLVLTDHPDLFKVQFVRLKNSENRKDLFDYSLLALDTFTLAQNTDRSLFFESLDAIAMAVLNYSADVILLHCDVFSLPLLTFIGRLSTPCLVLGDEIYSMYGIGSKKKQEDGQQGTEMIYLEDYDKEENEDFQATTYLSKVPIDKNKR
ncbi:MAG: hypothetical protein LKJ88_06840 [Bacilli bacterium]|jgi:hypothetical protein|nr:hypothetical protein [Bacilli bacterium]